MFTVQLRKGLMSVSAAISSQEMPSLPKRIKQWKPALFMVGWAGVHVWLQFILSGKFHKVQTQTWSGREKVESPSQTAED